MSAGHRIHATQAIRYYVVASNASHTNKLQFLSVLAAMVLSSFAVSIAWAGAGLGMSIFGMLSLRASLSSSIASKAVSGLRQVKLRLNPGKRD